MSCKHTIRARRAILEIYSSVVTRNTDSWRARLGPFARLDIHTRSRMASHGISWVSGAHVRFGNLDFIITMEGELAQAPAAVQPLHSAGLDAIDKALEEL